MNLSKKMTYLRAISLPFRILPIYTIIGLLDNLIWLAIAPINVLITAYFIDTALSVVSDDLPITSIILPLVALGAFQIYGYIQEPFMTLINTKSQMKTQQKLRIPLVKRRAQLEFKHLENRETADLLNRVWNGPENQLGNMLNRLIGFISLSGRTISFIIILLAHAWLTGSLLIALSVPLLWLAIKAGKASFQAERDTTELSRLHWTIGGYLDGRETAGERNLFGYTKKLSEKYIAAFENVRKYRLKVQTKWFLRTNSSALLLGGISAAALFMLAPEVAAGNISVGLYIAIMGALFRSIDNLCWNLPWFFEEFSKQREFLKEFNQFLDLSQAPGAEALPTVNPPVFEKLEFKDVTFSYPGTDKVVLDKLSLTIESGKHYAFVGANGTGKTTITKLITRLYDDYTGTILLNEKELREWPISDIKAMFCAVFQDFARYDVTVEENVKIGKIGGADDNEVDNAIRLSGFDEKVAELKDGKHTLLGKTHEQGVDLSGGEWQRLAFARTIISPAAVKILDEPTAALDPIAESQVYSQFESISRGITTIFISHRLASAKMADVIYVLEGGKVLEYGSHANLLDASGLYAKMFESQQSWYV